MGPSLWIPADWQFGRIEPGEARQGASRQVVAEAIKRRLFRGETAYFDRVRAYLDTLSKVRATRLNSPLCVLWTAFFSVEPGTFTPPAAARPDDVDPFPDAFESSFCLAIHALCAECALHWVALAQAPRRETDFEANGAEDGATAALEVPAAVSDAGGSLWALHSDVLTAITALLWQTPELRRWARDLEKDASADPAPVARQFAAILLQALLETLEDMFVTVTGPTETHDGQPYTPKYILLTSQDTARTVRDLVASLPFLFTVQPLKQPVAYRLPDNIPKDADAKDGFRVELFGYRRSNAFLRRLHAGMLKATHRAPELDAYLEAVNLQQAVPWRVNRELLYWVRRLQRIARGEDVGELADSLEANQVESLAAWVGETLYRPAVSGARRAYERSAEFLDSPLAERALGELCSGNENGDPQYFYLPWKADYRGRIFAETPWLTPQGGDLQRALFEFGNGRMLDDEGARALRRHGGNLVARGRLLADLAIGDRQVLTLEERERWVAEHEERILASAETPLGEPFWREVSEKPMQFLAFCLAYRKWKVDPEAPVHLPVQIDGTCNGLQHIAALIGNQPLARAVNVLPREDGLPGDIYSELADHAAASLAECTFAGPHKRGLELAVRWLCFSEARRGWLNRGTAKKVVMTIPYGAGVTAQADHVLEAIEADFESHWADAPPQAELEDLVEWKKRHWRRSRFVTQVSRGRFQRKSRPPGSAGIDQELKQELLRTEREHKCVLAAYVARVIVRYLRAALSEKYPAVDDFAAWLGGTADICAGLPLLWLSPLGFPVCQDKFTLLGTSSTVRLESKEVRLDLQRLGDTVNDKKQRDALLPNLIHSLDATHLAKTLLSAAHRGITDIGSIHDCLLCHPNDAAALAEVTRATFAELYRSQAASASRDEQNPAGLAKVLADWRDWMTLQVRLKNLPADRVNVVVGALDNPAGLGEQMLEKTAEAGDEGAAATLELIQQLRALEPARRYLAHCVLDYLQCQDVDGSAAETLPNTPATGALPLAGGSAISEYFFS